MTPQEALKRAIRGAGYGPALINDSRIPAIIAALPDHMVIVDDRDTWHEDYRKEKALADQLAEALEDAANALYREGFHADEQDAREALRQYEEARK